VNSLPAELVVSKGHATAWPFLVQAWAVFALAGCGPSEPPDPVVADQHHHAAGAPADDAPAPEQPDGHRRMVEILVGVAEQSKQENPYLGQGMAPKVRDDLAALPEDEIMPKRWFLRMVLASQELRLGNQERAIELYREAYGLLAESSDPVPRENLIQNAYEMGVAYMRWGETRNCVERHTSESCLMPIREGGIHVDREGSENAVRYLTEAIDNSPRGGREFMRAVWLLNIAHMTLGSWPAGVPENARIPPELFESDEEFPRFPEIAGRLGLGSFDLAGGAIADDFDGDGYLDLMVTSSDTVGPLRLYRNNADGSFTDRTRSAGLEGLFGGLNLLQADYDNDGDIDAFVLRGGWWRQIGRHPNSLLRNNGDGTFTDVTFESGLGEVHYPTQTAAWGDYDLDGDLDLYIGNESGKALRFDDGTDDDATAPCQLFRNDGNGRFTDVAREAGVMNLRYTKGVVWGDYDDDRYPDLYVSNGGHLNRLYRNNGDGTFTDVAERLGVEHPISSFPIWFWDVNNDGALDLFVSAYGGPKLPPDVASVAAGYLGIPDPGGNLPHLYLGDGRGGFENVAEAWNIARPTLPMGANFGDLDNDGYPDFYLGTGYPYYEALMPNVMYRNRGGAGFADVTTAGGFGHLQKGHGVVFADLDNDGDQDVFEQIGGAWPGDAYANALFLNPGFDRHWIRVSLVGVRSNRQGVGARIRVDLVEDGVPRSIYTRVSSGGSFGANPLRREIGLGAARRVAAIEIDWPVTGETQRFEDVAVDQWIEVTEGAAEFRTRNAPSVAF
jgi:hypothetical protein